MKFIWMPNQRDIKTKTNKRWILKRISNKFLGWQKIRKLVQKVILDRLKSLHLKFLKCNSEFSTKLELDGNF